MKNLKKVEAEIKKYGDEICIKYDNFSRFISAGGANGLCSRWEADMLSYTELEKVCKEMAEDGYEPSNREEIRKDLQNLFEFDF
jgi:hypothetical protein